MCDDPTASVQRETRVHCIISQRSEINVCQVIYLLTVWDENDIKWKYNILDEQTLDLLILLHT